MKFKGDQENGIIRSVQKEKQGTGKAGSQRACWHFVTFGLSELYEKESENKELSGMTDAELKTLANKASVIDIYGKLGSDLTDYRRESLL